MTECTISVYIGSKSSAAAKIEPIEALIDAMMLRMTESIDGSTSTVDEHQMDDGQMKVHTKYRRIADLEDSINYRKKKHDERGAGGEQYLCAGWRIRDRGKQP